MMKIRKYIKKTIAIGLIFTLALSSTACTKKTEGAKVAVKEETQDEKTDLKDDAEGSDGVQKIKVAWQTNSYPLQYEDEDGNLTGYEIEVLKLVDEALPQYEFEFGEPTSQDAQYAGLSAGKYEMLSIRKSVIRLMHFLKIRLEHHLLELFFLREQKELQTLQVLLRQD